MREEGYQYLCVPYTGDTAVISSESWSSYEEGFSGILYENNKCLKVANHEGKFLSMESGGVGGVSTPRQRKQHVKGQRRCGVFLELKAVQWARVWKVAPAGRVQTLGACGPCCTFQPPYLRKWRVREVNKQESSTTRKGFTFYQKLCGWRVGNGLEMTSLNVGLLQYSGQMWWRLDLAWLQ